MRDEEHDDEGSDSEVVADTEATVRCPYCSEEVEISLDPDGGEAQEYVEDCAVCCQPWQLNVHYDLEGRAEVTATALDE